LKNKYFEVDWNKIKDFRNLVAHDYLGIDAEEVWQIIYNHLPKGDIVMVHASLRSVGAILGGPDTLIAALLTAVGRGGTIMAYTDWQDGVQHMHTFAVEWIQGKYGEQPVRGDAENHAPNQ
jgi:hypothetical protein